MGKTNLKLSLDIRDKAKALYLAGEKVQHIAYQLGVQGHNVHQWAVRGGWKPLRQAVIERTNQRLLKTEASVKDKLIHDHQERIHRVTGAKLGTLEQFNPKKASEHLEIARALKTLDDVARRNLGLDEEGAVSKHHTIRLDLGTYEAKPVYEVEPSESVSTSVDNGQESPDSGG